MNATQVQVGFSRPRARWALLSALIRAIDGVPFSHTYLRFSINAEVPALICEARGLTVHLQGEESWCKIEEPIHIIDLELSKDRVIALATFCIQQLQKPYSIRELLGAGLARVLRLKNNPFKAGTSAFICSSLVARALGLENPDSLHPSDIWNLLQQSERND